MDEFFIKPQVYFGANALDALNELHGSSALLVTDQAMVQLGFAQQIQAMLAKRQIICHQYDNIESDPDIAAVARGMQLMVQHQPDIVIALGGGSVIDAAKAIIYCLWHFQQNKRYPKPYFVAIPTTSGTGSEVTSFAVIKARQEKLVLVDSFMLPDIAILDPQLVTSVPAVITADTGMDVLCHALEAYVSLNASDFSDALAEKVVQLIFCYLPICYLNGSDLNAREKMHNASCLAGMAFTHASLGITHSLAHALGSIFRLPHGRANALMMSQVIAYNADIEGDCNTTAAYKYANLARLLGLPCHSIREGVNSLLIAVETLRQELNIPGNLSQAGIKEQDFQAQLAKLAKLALQDNCTPTNPRKVDIKALTALYHRAYHGSVSVSVYPRLLSGNFE